MDVDLAALPSEQSSADWADLDQWDIVGIVRLMAAEEARVPASVRDAAVPLARAIEAIVDRLSAGGRLRYIGAGSAGRIAALDAAECAPTFGVSADLVAAVVAGGSEALADAREGLEDVAEAGAADLRTAGLAARDAVVGVSASGRTPYVVGALRYAREIGACTITITCNRETDLGDESDVSVEVPVGPEVVAGSTRLKAGSAQKLVLNIISTVVMVRLGHTYGNLMVGVRPDNEKLRRRRSLMLEQATGAGAEDVDVALAECSGDAKVALVHLIAGVSPSEAARRLASAAGRVRLALLSPPEGRSSIDG
jgi:N-acetylmuramic acid 6-phosphate etherase